MTDLVNIESEVQLRGATGAEAELIRLCWQLYQRATLAEAEVRRLRWWGAQIQQVAQRHQGEQR